MNSTSTEAHGSVEAQWLGRVPFAEALELQLAAREAVIGGGPQTLLLVEHPPTFTIGRRGKREDILWSDEELARRGVEMLETPRGGEVTLHAPGQLVAYPILHIGRKIRAHLEHLGAATVATLQELGVEGAEFRMDNPGVWIAAKKIASIGVHISRGVSVQGLSLNLAVDPTLFEGLVSCGMRSVQMVSARDYGARPDPLEEVAGRWAVHFAGAAGLRLAWPAIL